MPRGYRTHAPSRFEAILEHPPRLPFTTKEHRITVEYVRMSIRDGRELIFGDPFQGLHTASPAPVSEADMVKRQAEAGFMCLEAREEIGVDFLFAKVDAGRGWLFGGPTARYSYYAGNNLDGLWSLQGASRSWGYALSWIATVFKTHGR